MSDVEQHGFEEGPRLPAGGLGATGPADALARIRRTLGADHVSVVRRSPGRHALEVVAVSGRRFVSAGVGLPLDTCDLLVRALGGLAGGLDLSEAETPFEALAYAVDLEAAIALPVATAEDAVIAGAVLVAWERLPASTEAVTWAVAEERATLVGLLRPATATAKRIVVAHRDPLAAHGVAGLARERLGVEAATCGSLAGLLDLVADAPVDALLCDAGLDGRALAELAYRLRTAGIAAPPIVAIAPARTPAAVAEARGAGAAGSVALDDPPERLLAVVEAVLGGRVALADDDAAPTGRAGDDAAPAGAADGEPVAPALTGRERQVLRALDRGLNDAEIARELGIAATTAKSYARRVVRKLDATSRAGAVHRARREGLLG